MNVEIGTEAAQFPEKEYINGIFLAVCAVLFTLSAKLVLVYESNWCRSSLRHSLTCACLSLCSCPVLFLSCPVPVLFLLVSLYLIFFTCLSALVFSTIAYLFVCPFYLNPPVSLCDYRLFVCLLSDWFFSVCLSLWLSFVLLFVFVTIDCLSVLNICLLSASLTIVRVPVYVSDDLSACLSLWLSSMCMPISLNIVCVTIWLSDYRLYAYLSL